jgi:hypothetical protein
MSHWYTNTGAPMYTIVGANGKERNTTLRDARKLNLVPSVTTVMSVEDKPGLLVWMKNQILEAAVRKPFVESEYDADFWKSMILQESEQIGKKAAEKGSIIHDGLEQFYKTGSFKNVKEITGNYDLKDFVYPVIEFMEESFPGVQWISEESFCSELGFGGKVDMYSPQGMVLDFKTKDTADIKKMIAYDQHHMQTAAYDTGLYEKGAFIGINPDDIRRYNLFISTHVPGLITLTESTDFAREWGMFLDLLSFWQKKNNYVPNIGG